MYSMRFFVAHNNEKCNLIKVFKLELAFIPFFRLISIFMCQVLISKMFLEFRIFRDR